VNGNVKKSCFVPGACDCDTGYVGDDCSIAETDPPELDSVQGGALIDISVGVAKYLFVEGADFVDSDKLTCHYFLANVSLNLDKLTCHYFLANVSLNLDKLTCHYFLANVSLNLDKLTCHYFLANVSLNLDKLACHYFLDNVSLLSVKCAKLTKK
jgi:hypothetical protein